MRISDWSSDVCSSDLLGFARRDDRLGALSGRLHGSNPRGVSDVNGVAILAGGLGPIPVGSLRFEGAAVRFGAAGRCVEARGRLRLTVTAPIARLDLSRGLDRKSTRLNSSH